MLQAELQSSNNILAVHINYILSCSFPFEQDSVSKIIVQNKQSCQW